MADLSQRALLTEVSNLSQTAEFDDPDLWRLAAMLIRWHGEDAESYAHLRADEALQRGNNRSSQLWKRIAAGVSGLEQRRLGHSLH
ncbi:MAG TPA: hypothetical protein VGO49_20245 [Bradyrhizobium sp.]|nr:hypothetical protein [Bradyrhizobium sp.]